MNYNRIYTQLIEKAKLENNLDNVYYERHHIIPKSLGGPNTKSNLVKLVPRQHYIAHLLLFDYLFLLLLVNCYLHYFFLNILSLLQMFARIMLLYPMHNYSLNHL